MKRGHERPARRERPVDQENGGRALRVRVGPRQRRRVRRRDGREACERRVRPGRDVPGEGQGDERGRLLGERVGRRDRQPTSCPTVTTLTTDSPKTENSVVTATVVVTDPGWLDTLTATIDWGDGAARARSPARSRTSGPTRRSPRHRPHTYGDNGTFTVTVCASDDDGAGSCRADLDLGSRTSTRRRRSTRRPRRRSTAWRRSSRTPGRRCRSAGELD